MNSLEQGSVNSLEQGLVNSLDSHWTNDSRQFLAGSGILLGLLLIVVLIVIGYKFWYFQQMTDVVEQMDNRQNQEHSQPEPPKPPQKPVMLSKVSLPAPPALAEQAPKQPQAAPVQQLAATQPPVETKPASKATPKETPKSKAKPTAKPVIAVVDVVEKAQPQRTVDVSADAMVAQASEHAQYLLNQVESGQGPAIEIAWPKSFAGRKKLFHTLVNCQGVQLGILSEETVHPVNPNVQPYSRLVRMVSGMMLPQERSLYQSSRYYDKPGSTPVRLFPRALDARLLAGLRQLAVVSFESLASVRGLYVLKGQRLFIQDLVMDGQAVAGQVLLADGGCQS